MLKFHFPGSYGPLNSINYKCTKNVSDNFIDLCSLKNNVNFENDGLFGGMYFDRKNEA